MKPLLFLLFVGIAAAQNPGVCSRVLNSPAPGQVLSATNTSHTPPCQWTNNGGGGGSVSLTATGPIVITPSPTTGTGVISCPTCSTGGLTVGTTTITSGTNTRILFDNSGVLGEYAVGTGIPTLLATPSSANLASALTDETGTSLAVFNTSPLLVTPHVTTILDGNGNPFLVSTAATSAVDSITITNSATANPATVVIAASGTDTNINLYIQQKGVGEIVFPGSQGDNFVKIANLGGADADLYIAKHNSGDSGRMIYKQGGTFTWTEGTIGNNNWSLSDVVAGTNVFTVTSGTAILTITGSSFGFAGKTCVLSGTAIVCT